MQRIVRDLPETMLEFAPETHVLSLGAEKSEADMRTVAADIQQYLQIAESAKTEPEIEDAVEGKTGVKRKALRLLVGAGKVRREGTGRRGDPFRYSFSFSCSPDTSGTREQETEKGPEASKNTGDILVPGCSRDSMLVPAPGEQANRPIEEGEL